jgi:uncharacterized repeat protein (TIGR03803 family)
MKARTTSFAGDSMKTTRFALLVIVLFTLCLISSTAYAQTVTVVHAFNGTNGELPRYGSLVQSHDGALYGTTQAGGSAGLGVIFKQQTTGNGNAVVHSLSGSDGSFLIGGLTLATDGNYYGTSVQGGTAKDGTLFKVSPQGAFTVLYSFTGGTDGAFPSPAPIEGADGSFYGITGGSDPIHPTVYKFTAPNTLTTIYAFPDFGLIAAPLLQTSDGALYAVDFLGGTYGCGVVVKLSPTGVLKATHSFGETACVGKNPDKPVGALIQGADGSVYGTDSGGGTSNDGAIFKLDAQTGQLTVLYSFGSITNDGIGPAAGLVEGTDGNFYGNTTGGGAAGAGTIFKIAPSGTYTQLYSFPKARGTLPLPQAALTQHANGAFYGTTEFGGSSVLGTIYKLDMGLGPFVTFVLATGRLAAPRKF